MGKVQLSDHEKGVIDGMHRVGTSARTIAKSILKEAWESMPPDILENLVESMPRRCQMVIDSKGYPIKY